MPPLQPDLGVLCVLIQSSIIPGVWDLSWSVCHVISTSGPASFFYECIGALGKTIATASPRSAGSVMSGALGSVTDVCCGNVAVKLHMHRCSQVLFVQSSIFRFSLIPYPFPLSVFLLLINQLVNIYSYSSLNNPK